MFTQQDTAEIFYPIYFKVFTQSALSEINTIREKENDHLDIDLEKLNELEVEFNNISQIDIGLYNDYELPIDFLSSIEAEIKEVLTSIDEIRKGRCISKNSLYIVAEYYGRLITARELNLQWLFVLDFYFNNLFVNHFEEFIDLMESIFEKNIEANCEMVELDLENCSFVSVSKRDVLEIQKRLITLRPKPVIKKQIQLFNTLLNGVLKEDLCLFLTFE